MRCLLIEVQPEQLDDLHSWSKVFKEPRHVQGGILAMLAMRAYKEFRLMDEAAPIAIEGLMSYSIAALSRRDNLFSDRRRPRWLDQASRYSSSTILRRPGRRQHCKGG